MEPRRRKFRTCLDIRREKGPETFSMILYLSNIGRKKRRRKPGSYYGCEPKFIVELTNMFASEDIPIREKLSFIQDMLVYVYTGVNNEMRQKILMLLDGSSHKGEQGHSIKDILKRLYDIDILCIEVQDGESIGNLNDLIEKMRRKLPSIVDVCEHKIVFPDTLDENFQLKRQVAGQAIELEKLKKNQGQLEESLRTTEEEKDILQERLEVEEGRRIECQEELSVLQQQVSILAGQLNQSQQMYYFLDMYSRAGHEELRALKKLHQESLSMGASAGYAEAESAVNGTLRNGHNISPPSVVLSPTATDDDFSSSFNSGVSGGGSFVFESADKIGNLSSESGSDEGYGKSRWCNTSPPSAFSERQSSEAADVHSPLESVGGDACIQEISPEFVPSQSGLFSNYFLSSRKGILNELNQTSEPYIPKSGEQLPAVGSRAV